MVFCNHERVQAKFMVRKVTILILIDGFLQLVKICLKVDMENCHNPYFNRWFSAIIGFKEGVSKEDKVTILILIDGFLQ